MEPGHFRKDLFSGGLAMIGGRVWGDSAAKACFVVPSWVWNVCPAMPDWVWSVCGVVND